MSLIHPLSEECSKSELELFSIPPTQVAIQSSYTNQYNPISSIVEASVIDFAIAGNADEYIALADTELCVTAKIEKEDGSALTAAESVTIAPCNYFLHSLFSQIDVTVGDRLVSGATNSYPYVAYLESLLSFSPDVKESQLASSLWVHDNNKDENFKKRSAISKQSAVFQMVGRLHVDFFKTPRLLVNNVDLHVRLTRSKDSFCVEGNADCTISPKVVISECCLKIRKVRPSPTIFTEHQRILQTSNCRYPYRKVVTKVVSIPSGNQSVHCDNLFLGQLPVRLVVGFVYHENFNGALKTSPFDFPHLNLNYLALNVNGIQVPARPLTPNFDGNRYGEAYMTLFHGMGISWKNSTHGITPDVYKNGCALYAFDLTPDDCGNSSSHVNLVNSGVLRLEAKFSKNLSKSVNLICYAEMENVVEIDFSRNVIVEQ